jgi:hypothetical protein
MMVHQWLASRLIFVLFLSMFVGFPAAPFGISLGPPELVPNTSPGVPVYPWFPDGHITVLDDGSQLQMYWAGSSSYRTIGSTLETMSLSPTVAVISRGAAGSFDNGGAWLMAVFRQSGDNLIGFYHAEDHEWTGYENPDNIAWKSIAVCASGDNGVSWTKHGQIITSHTLKPAEPTWGGCGDHCVVYDAAHGRWVMFYQEHWIKIAISTDPDGRPGTWFKYKNGAFTEPGLGGEGDPVPGLETHPGANPSVHYNEYLRTYVMVWHTWQDLSVYLSTSDDLIHWDTPRLLVAAGEGERVWYPTIIGTTDQIAGADVWLYYAYWPDRTHWQRQFLRRPIHFSMPEVSVSTAPAQLIAPVLLVALAVIAGDKIRAQRMRQHLWHT